MESNHSKLMFPEEIFFDLSASSVERKRLEVKKTHGSLDATIVPIRPKKMFKGVCLENFLYHQLLAKIKNALIAFFLQAYCTNLNLIRKKF